MSETTSQPASDAILWQGSPSQFLSFRWYLLALVLALAAIPLFLFTGPLSLVYLIIPALFVLIPWMLTRSCVYTLTRDRLRYRTGILTHTTDELELYRVRDTTVTEPFMLRLVGCGHVMLATSDRSHPEMTIRGVRDPHGLRDMLRQRVEALRTEKKVREVDFE